MDRSKYLTPYRPIKRLDIRPACDYGRYSIPWNTVIAMVYQINDGSWTHSYTKDYDRRYFDTKESAMTSMDTMLANGGYILLTEEQALLV